MRTREAISICSIYRDGGGERTPEICKRRAETAAAVEARTYGLDGSFEDHKLARDFCRPIENCQGKPLMCCNPDIFHDLLDISKH